MRNLARLACAIALASLAACTTDTSTTAAPLCGMDFSVDVTDGPSAGMHVAGQLQIAMDPNGDELAGSLIPTGVAVDDDADQIPVSGTYDGSSVTLRFDTANGTIVGTGPWNGQCTHAAQLSGNAMGPRPGDGGHWLGSITDECLFGTKYSCAAAIALEAGKRACFAGCSYAGNTDAHCNQTCGTDN
ncbi:MAG TPA: hypothetical protein VHE35_34700 [Kofleriaceae bacterium]|nr:hypothetical protein [Kofleriaceae bacterium]